MGGRNRVLADNRRTARSVSLLVPVVTLVFACTAIPIQLQPWSAADLAGIFEGKLDVPDIVANVVGFAPLGMVLASRGAWPAIALATALSSFSEATQLFSRGRSPSLIDVVTNVMGAAIGIALGTRWKVRFDRVAIGKRGAGLALAIAAAYVLSGAATTADDIEDAITLMLKVPPWREASARGGADGRLEARWTFDTIRDQMALDESGNGLNGLLVNRPGLVTGVEGRAISLNGVNQWLDVGDPVALRLTGSLSISAWINASSFPVDDAAIASDYTGLGYQLDTTSDQGPRTIGFKLADASGRLMARYGRTPLELNQWYHVAGVYDAQARTLRVFLNGRPDDGCLIGHITGRQHISGVHVFVGRRGGQRGYEFAGSIDDVRIYSRAVAQSELEAEIHAVRPTPTLPAPSTPRAPNGIPASSDVERACRAPAGDSDPDKVAGPVVIVGMLVAFGCVGLWPTSRFRVPCLILSFLTGFLLIPSITPVVPAFFRSLVPLLTLAGGASVAVSVRDDPSHCRPG
jgi:Concanavalin A-like lectin/glucanases superfamily/VanZ like family